MLKPHTVLLLSALLALCAAGLLTVAHREPKAALAAGYALLAGITSLALYLNSRQKASRESEVISTSFERETSAHSEDKTPRHASNTAPKTTNESKPNRYEPRYTSHSRA